MYYQTPYWYWTNAIDDKWINQIKKLAKKKKLRKARVGEKLEVNANIRRSNITFLPEDNTLLSMFNNIVDLPCPGLPPIIVISPLVNPPANLSKLG